MHTKPKYSLLYVEDEESIRRIAISYLGEYFTQIYEAGDGKVALEIYKDKKPDIIITDIEMPKMNGLEFCKEIRKNDDKTPIIITTAYTTTEYLLEAVSLNLVKYLVKPIEEESLFEALTLCFEKIESKNPSIIKLTKKHNYDTLNHILTYDGKIVKLSARESKFLDILIKNQNRVISYAEIENYIWQEKGMSEDALRCLVRNIRKIINKDVIENISKSGYKINPHG